MKKTKLFFTIASMCIAFAVLVFGIYALDYMDYSINGTLTYEVKECFVTVETSVYYSPTYLAQDDLYSKMELIVTSNNVQNLTLLPTENLDYNSYTDRGVSANNKELTLYFEGKKNQSPKQAYFIVMNVTNLGGRDINVGVNAPIELPQNIYSINSGLWTGLEPDESKRLVIVLSLEDRTSPVTPRYGQTKANYSLTLKADVDDEDTTQLNVFDFNPITHGIRKTTRLETLATDLYVPSYHNGSKVTKAYDFSDCTKITSITIPNTVVEMGEGIFANCPSLKSMTLPFIGKANYESYDDVCEQEDGDFVCATAYYMFGDEYEEGLQAIGMECDENYYYRYIPAGLNYLEILPGCTYIGANAFVDSEMCNVKIQNLHLPYGIKKIDDCAFEYFEYLKYVNLPRSLEYIGMYSFSTCNDLTEVTIPCSVTYMGVGAFDYCESLSSLIIEEGVTYVGGFCHTAITTLNFPSTLITVGQFYGLSIERLVIPEGVTTILDYAFTGCQDLVDVVLPNTLKIIGADAFSGCGFRTIYIPEQVERIGSDAFSECPNLVKIEIPGGVKFIRINNCENLKEIILNEGLERIEDYSIRNCPCLTKVKIPSTVTYIGMAAFNLCKSLKTIIIEGNQTTDMESRGTFFYGKLNNGSFGHYYEEEDGYYIYVPDEYYDFYMDGPSYGWSGYAEDGVIKKLSEIPEDFVITYQIADGVVDDGHEMPYTNMLNKLDPTVWHQFNASVVTRDNMGSYANSIYSNTDGGETNAIYTDINLIPSNTIEYTIRVPHSYKVFIYTFNIGSNTFASTTPMEYECYHNDDIWSNLIFGKNVYKIRFILVRFEHVMEWQIADEGREYFDQPVQLVPSQIVTSKFTNTWMSATNTDDGESYGSKTFVGYYKPGIAIELPTIMLSPYKYYDFRNWLTDLDDTSTVVTSLPASQVTKYGDLFVYAQLEKKIKNLYFKLNYDGTEDYIQVEGVAIEGYGEGITISAVLDAVFATAEIQNLMRSKGLVLDEDGYPINSSIESLFMEPGIKGYFSCNRYDNHSWILRENFYNGGMLIFTTADIYIYVGEWSSSSVQDSMQSMASEQLFNWVQNSSAICSSSLIFDNVRKYLSNFVNTIITKRNMYVI